MKLVIYIKSEFQKKRVGFVMYLPNMGSKKRSKLFYIVKLSTKGCCHNPLPISEIVDKISIGLNFREFRIRNPDPDYLFCLA